MVCSGFAAAAPDGYISQFYELNKKVDRMPKAERAAAWVKVRDAADAEGDRFYSYFAGIKAAHAHNAERQLEEAAAEFERALEFALTKSGGVHSRFENEMSSVTLSLLHLRTCYVRSARMALGEATQTRTETFLNRWAETYQKGEFDCLNDQPPARFPRGDRYLLRRICSARAELLDLRARTVEGAALLERSLDMIADERRPDAYTMSEELRSRNNLAVMLSFLGWTEDAVDLYEKIERAARPPVSKWQRHAALARVNRLEHQMKANGYTRELVDQSIEAAKIVSETSTYGRDDEMKQVVAKLEARLGDTERASALYAQLDAELEESDLEFLKLYCRRGRLVELDERDEAEFIDLLTRYRERGLRRGEPTLYREYAQFLAGEGRLEEAVQMIARAASMSESFGWELHLPMLWMEQAGWHDELGQHEAADALWRRIEALVARISHIPAIRLAWIDEARIERSIIRGKRFQAGLQLVAAKQGVADRKLTEHQLGTHRANLKLLAAEYTKGPSPLEQAPVAKPVPATVDLQPIAVRTQFSGDRAARTRFSLSNIGADLARGQLQAQGLITNARWDEEALVWHIEAGGATRSKITTPPLRCPAGARILIELQAAVGEGDLELSWVPGKGAKAAQARRWEWNESAGDSSVASMTTAHLAKRNPFYLVPLYQEIHGPAGTQNFRITASAPCRLEIADSEGNAIAIDANADGEFTGKGDALIQDIDGDLVPDVELSKAMPTAGIEVSLFADGRSGSDPIRLLFQLRGSSGAWETVAESVVE